MLRKQDLEERLCCARRICGKETEQNNKKRKRKLVKRNSQRRKRIFKSSFSPLLFLLLTQHHIYIYPSKVFPNFKQTFSLHSKTQNRKKKHQNQAESSLIHQFHIGQEEKQISTSRKKKQTNITDVQKKKLSILPASPLKKNI